MTLPSVSVAAQLAAALSSDLRLAGVDHLLTGSLVAPSAEGPPAEGAPDVGVVIPSIREMRAVFEIAGRHGFLPEDGDGATRPGARFQASLRCGAVELDVVVPMLPFHDVLEPKSETCEVAGVGVSFVTPDDLAPKRGR